MTVSNAAGSGSRKKKAKGGGSLGAVQFKMSMMREVLKRRNQIGKKIKERMEANILREETKLEGEFHMRKLETEMKKLKKEIQELMKKAGKEAGEIPEVKIKLQVTFPKRAETITLREKDVRTENLKRLGIPGAKTLEKAVMLVQSQIDEVKEHQSNMLNEVEKLIKTMKTMDQ